MQKHGLAPKKSLGQNFLLDENITHKVASVAGNLSGVHVIEVGPGPGGLTRSLLDLGAEKITAIEMDQRCVLALEDLQDKERLSVLHQDALKVDFKKLFDETAMPIKIIANLPYNVATELLFRWLPLSQHILSLTLMFQKEVVDRIVANPNTKDYGRLSVMVQWLSEATKAFDLPPSVFTPPPKVTSSVVHIVPKSKSQDISYELMERVVKAAFSQRRKMLRSSLKALSPVLCEKAGIDETRRAETLSIREFEQLSSAFKS